MRFFSKHPYLTSILGLTGVYAVFFVVVGLLSPLFPAAGIRDAGFKVPEVRVLSQVNSGSGATSGWTLNSASYSDGSIEISNGGSIVSPIFNESSTKAVEIVLAENVDATAMSLLSYSGSEEGGGLVSQEAATPVYQNDEDGFLYKFRFSFDRPEISAVSLGYNGQDASAKALLVRQFSFCVYA